jgi:hypothetical protein
MEIHDNLDEHQTMTDESLALDDKRYFPSGW